MPELVRNTTNVRVADEFKTSSSNFQLAFTSREERKAGPGIHFNKQALRCVWYSTSIVVIASRRNYMVQ